MPPGEKLGQDRYDLDDPDWYLDRFRSPLTCPQRTTREVEEIVRITRLSLYNQALFSGVQAILWKLEELSLEDTRSKGWHQGITACSVV